MERGFIWMIVLSLSLLVTGCVGCKSVAGRDYTAEGQQFEKTDNYKPWWK